MSKTYIAALVALLSALLPLLGFEIADSEALTNGIANIVTVIAALWAIWGRVQVGDISWIGLRKK
jgi:hypothetical protein